MKNFILITALLNLTISIQAMSCDPEGVDQCPQGQYCEQVGEIMGAEYKKVGVCKSAPINQPALGFQNLAEARKRTGTRLI